MMTDTMDIKNPAGPEDLVPWEVWSHGVLRSCRLASINSILAVVVVWCSAP